MTLHFCFLAVILFIYYFYPDIFHAMLEHRQFKFEDFICNNESCLRSNSMQILILENTCFSHLPATQNSDTCFCKYFV